MQLEPLSYHLDVAAKLAAAEPELWAWFRSDQFAEKYKAATTADLLRTAIRLERGGIGDAGPNARRYALAEQARDALGIAAPITLYQMQDTSGTPNAFLVYTAGEIVIAFMGRILELLDTDAELLDLLGHEIAHYKLFTEADGRYHTVDRLLSWLVQRDHCPAEFAETWRRNRLYTEIYCDIGGLIACGDRDATIRGLVKALADFKDADASQYLKQAEALMATGPGATRGTTHPELHVRALAVGNVTTLSRAEFDALLRGLIAGPIELGGLDLVDQARLGELTRLAVERLLSEPETRSETALAHAGQFFSASVPPAGHVPRLQSVATELAASSADYLAYVLLDFATVEDATSRGAIAVAAAVADELGLGARFRELARQEFKGRRAILSGLTSRAA
jgi:Peptidase family M48